MQQAHSLPHAEQAVTGLRGRAMTASGVDDLDRQFALAAVDGYLAGRVSAWRTTLVTASWITR